MAGGLPHYKNSTAATKLWEPVYLAYFDVILTPPPGIADWPLVIENLTKVTGLDTNKFPAVQTQSYKGALRSYVGGKQPELPVEIGLSFEVNLNDNNSMYVYKALKEWVKRAYDYSTGKMGLKKDYVGGPLIISQYNANGDIFRQVIAPVVIPISNVPTVTEFDWSADGIYKIEDFKLRADYLDEVII